HPEPLERRWLLAVASRGRAHDLAHKPGLDQLMRAGVAVRGGVHDQGEIFRSAVAQRTNEDVRKAGAAKARYENRRPIGNISQRLCSARNTLVDRHCHSVLHASSGYRSGAAASPGRYGSRLIHVASASTTALGCSGMSAWLALGMTAMLTRS